MALGEFDIIRRFFAGLDAGPAVALGVGDDCALLEVPPEQKLAVTTDTLVAGVHFPKSSDPSLVARRSLRVNLSDLAAMGGAPLGFQLALTLPAVDEHWLARFSAGLAEDAGHYGCPLVGGDITRGPLTIGVTVLGSVTTGAELRRSGARAGDDIYVTGTLGDARGALEVLTGDSSGRDSEHLLSRYWLPEPRLAAGALLSESASAAIDVSDGLLQDLGHIADASGLGAELDLARLPVSPHLSAFAGPEKARRWALTGGDDYELCFTAPPGREDRLRDQLAHLNVPVARIGRMTPSSGVVCRDESGNVVVEEAGYDHFR